MDIMASAFIKATSPFTRISPSPDKSLGQLFVDVQERRIYKDGKIFADIVPKGKISQIKKQYSLEKDSPEFSIQEFVNSHFYTITDDSSNYVTDTSRTMRQHISELWPVLERKTHSKRGSLIPLPHAYVVPGGRFSEQFYWDSYFIMLGLAADNRWQLIEGMIKNYAYMIRKFGFVPTANRTYFLSRSQPPFLSHMVELLESHKGKRVLAEYLPYLLAEYRFWMNGKNRLTSINSSCRRVIQLPDGSILNRYFDDSSTPRPESHREDVETAKSSIKPQELYVDIRAAAESGWDFSSRWFGDGQHLETIETTSIIPIDLNCLLYHLEKTIARAYFVIKNPIASQRFNKQAKRRIAAVNKYCWNEKVGFFTDYNLRTNSLNNNLTAAGLFPLFVEIAREDQASSVADVAKRKFLAPGGLLTTLNQTAEQWDAPNGWAPLQLIAITGLRNYGYHQLASEIKNRWLRTNQKVIDTKGKMIEKYDITNKTGIGGGGEYPLQDGFGWTNGVAAWLIDEKTP